MKEIYLLLHCSNKYINGKDYCVHTQKVLNNGICDLLSLCLFSPPKEMNNSNYLTENEFGDDELSDSSDDMNTSFSSPRANQKKTKRSLLNRVNFTSRVMQTPTRKRLALENVVDSMEHGHTGNGFCFLFGCFSRTDNRCYKKGLSPRFSSIAMDDALWNKLKQPSDSSMKLEGDSNLMVRPPNDGLLTKRSRGNSFNSNENDKLDVFYLDPDDKVETFLAETDPGIEQRIGTISQIKKTLHHRIIKASVDSGMVFIVMVMMLANIILGIDPNHSSIVNQMLRKLPRLAAVLEENLWNQNASEESLGILSFFVVFFLYKLTIMRRQLQ